MLNAFLDYIISYAYELATYRRSKIIRAARMNKRRHFDFHVHQRDRRRDVDLHMQTVSVTCWIAFDYSIVSILYSCPTEFRALERGCCFVYAAVCSTRLAS